VILAAFGDQEGMREEHAERRAEPQEIEIGISHHAGSTCVSPPLFRRRAGQAEARR
jgi:hypothetical protein